MDNTFFTPVFSNPLNFGADIVMQCVAKYIGGHSDVSAGALCTNDEKLYERMLLQTKAAGNGLPAFCSWLAIRGAKTMELRVKQAAANALALANYL